MTIDVKFFLNTCITIFSIEIWDFHCLRHSIDAEASGDHFMSKLFWAIVFIDRKFWFKLKHYIMKIKLLIGCSGHLYNLSFGQSS